MSRWLVLALLAVFAAAAGAPPAQAGPSQACDRLWYQRTAIFARRGKCFRDERALELFGQRCFPPYGKLSFREQRRVDNIKRQERRAGCST